MLWLRDGPAFEIETDLYKDNQQRIAKLHGLACYIMIVQIEPCWRQANIDRNYYCV